MAASVSKKSKASKSSGRATKAKRPVKTAKRKLAAARASVKTKGVRNTTAKRPISRLAKAKKKIGKAAVAKRPIKRAGKANKKTSKAAVAKRPIKQAGKANKKTGRAAAAKQLVRRTTKAKRPAAKTTVAQVETRCSRQKGSTQAGNSNAKGGAAALGGDVDGSASGGIAIIHPQPHQPIRRDASCTAPGTGASNSDRSTIGGDDGPLPTTEAAGTDIPSGSGDDNHRLVNGKRTDAAVLRACAVARTHVRRQWRRLLVVLPS